MTLFCVKRLCNFFVETLHDFFCGEVAFFSLSGCCMIFVWRGCVILCLERLRDFSYTLSHSLRLHDF